MSPAHRWGWAIAAVALAAGLAGCGTPGAPQPPSLHLPDRVSDLSATRAGNQVTLSWTMPKRNTDKLLLRENIAVRVCLQQAVGACVDSGALQAAPGKAATFLSTLPDALASGNPRVVSYFVELKNRVGRSAGLSNAAPVLAGAPPAPVEGLGAEIRKSGVVLHWATNGVETPVRLERRLLTPAIAKPKQSLLAQPAEPPLQNLLIEDAREGLALDKSIRFGASYEYRAQRVVQVKVDGRTLELDSAMSAPIQMEAKDIFPPAVPAGLAAVASVGENPAETAIDLSWQPDADADIAGYIVYRREGDEAAQRISPAEPVVGPAFHDAHVEPGRTYRYAVSAVDQSGHESARSVEAQETVPRN